jgi:hypothetical protein
MWSVFHCVRPEKLDVNQGHPPYIAVAKHAYTTDAARALHGLFFCLLCFVERH